MPTGRKSKLTPAVQERIVEAIRGGNYAQVAARCAGIDDSTFYRWLEKGEAEEEGAYRDFHDAVKAAEAVAEDAAVQCVISAMPDSWQAAMTFLERRFAQRWRRTQDAAPTVGEVVKVYVGIDDSKV